MNNIKIPDASGILGWSHYCELIAIKDENKRNFYEKETVNSKWSVRELQRQIETSLFERLLLSDGKANKEKVLQLAKEGQILNSPEDMIKDPFAFEFLGVPEKKPLLEKDLEYKLWRAGGCGSAGNVFRGRAVSGRKIRAPPKVIKTGGRKPERPVRRG